MENQKHGKIVRGFSMVDPEKVSKLHKDIKSSGKEEREAGNSYGYNFREIARFNFTLPDFSQFDNEFVEFLMKDLIENATLKALEGSGHLNWWTKHSSLQRLYPLQTSGDGNCLLHAASLGIWGIHDRCLTLRQAVHDTLSSSFAETTLKRRWLWYKWVKNLEEGLDRSADEWEDDWKEVLTLADAKPKSPCQPLSTVPEGSAIVNEGTSTSNEDSWHPRYESLEEIHILSLAHVLRRPIIVVADNWVYDFYGNLLSPIPFAGVYLPVECNPAECCRVPLVLAYSSSHFSPVVSMEQLNDSTESVDLKNSPNCQAKLSSSSVQSAILLNASSKPSSDKASKSSDVPTPTPNMNTTTSTIHAAFSSALQVTKSTLLQAVKTLTPSSMQTMPSTNYNQPIHAAIPLVDKDFKTLPLPFAAIPGENWNWLNKDKSEDIIKTESLTDEQRMHLLKKYLDVVDIDMSSKLPLSGENNEVNCLETQDRQVNSLKNCKIPVAVLPCDNQEGLYKDLSTQYLEKAKERFDFKKQTEIAKPEQNLSMKCANDECDLYGTAANNYLCTKCFQLQSKSVVKFRGTHPPPLYDPPSYSEAVANDQVFYPPTMAGKSTNTEKTTTLKELSDQCRAPGCTFYGTSDKGGFCSKCFLENNK